MIDDIYVYDWNAKDIQINPYSDSETEEETNETDTFLIRAFGITSDSKTVCLKVKNYTPFWFIELPNTWNDNSTKSFLYDLQDSLPKKRRNELLVDRSLKQDIRYKYQFRDYQWNKPKKFLQLVFKSEAASRMIYYKLKKPYNFYREKIRNHKFPIYEKNIQPLLRFFHLRKLKPTSWINISTAKNSDADSHFDYNLEINWRDINPIESDLIPPLKIAAYDIECNSSHGDFPLAKKDYKKLATNIEEFYLYTKNHGSKIVPSLIKNWIKCSFRRYNEEKFDDITKSYIQDTILKNPAELKFTTREYDALSMECLNILNKDVKSKSKIENLTYIFDSKFPKIKGDSVIQIGTVIKKFGTNDIKRIIFTLGGCSSLPGITVVPCKTVRDIVEGWVNMMKQEKIQILTGYNIFGFDYKFLYDNCDELNCKYLLNELSVLSDGSDVELTEKELFSAALGHNFLYYFEIPGLITLDLLKVIQKDHNLSSYKLDDVSTEFINGSIKKIDRSSNDIIKLFTNSTYSLKIGDMLALYRSSIIGKEFEENRYKICNIVNDECIEVKKSAMEISDMPENYYWSVGKDNVSPQDIFAMQDGSDEDRSFVAKYCIQDCQLCIDLIDKLEIISNNIGMSNVCLVPFSYLFLRGQMIKTLSLVSSECLKENYLIPELPKPREDIKDSYEGAEVLEPKPAIFIDEPVSVLDYSSLYPSSMIGTNISHDSIIVDEEFQGEKGAEKLRKRNIDFEDVVFDNYYQKLVGKTWKKFIDKKNPIVTCRFIQPPKDSNGKIIDSERGILPRILMKLLKARKDTRAQIKNEKDPFRASVLDGLQLAYKVTANSLYGGVGAAVSALYYKNIAAATTAVGRNHLHLAKNYTLEKFPSAEIVYGDSVTGYTPVTLKVNEKVYYEKIENIAKKFGKNKWLRCIEPGKQDKEACELDNVYTWTSKGWTELFRIFRHILVDSKKVMRVLTHTGCVDVTDDHSLILSNGKTISPKDLKIGDQLLTNECEENNLNRVVEFTQSNEVKKIHEIEYEGFVYDLTTENHEFQAGIGNIIVHNTDSIFVNFHPTKKGKEGIQESIDRSIEVEKGIQHLLAYPHKLEYEKTFSPFVLLRKKGYIGNKYEFDLDKYKQTSMGVVTKRRDNAPIVKYVYDGLIKKIINEKDIHGAVRFVIKTIDEILDGKFPIAYFIITKRLNANYANPLQIAHKVLADRMAERDPGNKPQSNDRIPFVYIHTKKKVKLQGERVEHPDYIQQNKLKIDYLFYITNQISKPVCQVIGLTLNKLRDFGYKLPEDHFQVVEEQLKKEKKKTDSQIREKIMELKQKEAYNLIFLKKVKLFEQRQNGQALLTDFFK